MRHRPVARGCLSAQNQGQLPVLNRSWEIKAAPNHEVQQSEEVDLLVAELRVTIRPKAAETLPSTICLLSKMAVIGVPIQTEYYYILRL
jgi:hypothetical protein